MAVEIGIGTFSGQRPADGSSSTADAYADILTIAAAAETAGFDSVWVSSHHGMQDDHVPSPLVLLAAVSAVTRRIGLGAAMILAPFQDPLRLAEDCTTLDQLSRGRVAVGLGVGWREEEFRQFGVPVRERARRTAELAEFCRLAWDQDEVTYAGEHLHYTRARVRPRPYHRIPLVLGGTAPAALRRAGRLADDFLATGTPQLGLDGMAAQLAIVDGAARDAGRDPAELGVGFQANCWVSPDGSLPEPVRDAMWRKISASLNAHENSAGSRDVDEAEIRRRAFIGTPEQVVEACRPWLGLLAGRRGRVLFRLQYPGLAAERSLDAVRLFGVEVAPALRALPA